MRKPCISEPANAAARRAGGGRAAALAAGLGLAAIAIALVAGAGRTAAPGASAPAADTPADAAVEPVAAPAGVAMAQPPAADTSRQLQLPDGTSVPALNGAVDAAPLSRYWGPWPWSPITGVVSDRGVDWYRHADGSFSTTQMVWRSDLGRKAAMTRVAHPGPTPPASR